MLPRNTSMGRIVCLTPLRRNIGIWAEGSAGVPFRGLEAPQEGRFREVEWLPASRALRGFWGPCRGSSLLAGIRRVLTSDKPGSGPAE
jgi:hypothetical protein